MDQKLEDIDPDARKKYDRDMKQQAKEALRRDALHLSDEDFGSKHGRDRTAKETAARNANETAGYKAAEAEEKALRQKAMKNSPDISNHPYYSSETAERKNKERIEKDIKSGQQSLDFEAPKPKPKGPSGGGGSGGMGTGKMNRDISKNMKAGGKVSSASKRADGCAVKGKTRGRIV
jgi:hypothetical protein